MDTIVDLFSLVCGQAPEHTWSPGGLGLPFCQRCSGLYAGAFFAALLHLLCRPRLSGRFLEIHGAFLLVMVPFGYHWVPQGPTLRAFTGVLFGFGVVTFLMLPLVETAVVRRWAWRKCDREDAPRWAWRYFGGVLGASCLVPLLGTSGAALAGFSLTSAACAGAMILVMLVLLDASLGIRSAARVLRSRFQGQAGA